MAAILFVGGVGVWGCGVGWCVCVGWGGGGGGQDELNANQTQSTKHNNTECICNGIHRIFLRAKQYYSNLYMTYGAQSIIKYINICIPFWALHNGMALKVYRRAIILLNSIQL